MFLVSFLLLCRTASFENKLDYVCIAEIKTNEMKVIVLSCLVYPYAHS
jgi:hypothetical protein